MKKTIIAIAILLAVNTGTFAQTHKANTHRKSTSTTVKYSCPMHKEVVMDKPGKCPKSGMTLVAVKKKKTTKGA